MLTIGVLGGFGPQATTEFENRVHEEARLVLPPHFDRGYPPMVTVHLRHARHGKMSILSFESSASSSYVCYSCPEAAGRSTGPT